MSAESLPFSPLIQEKWKRLCQQGKKSHECALKLTELWKTSLLFDLNYKFELIHRSFAFTLAKSIYYTSQCLIFCVILLTQGYYTTIPKEEVKLNPVNMLCLYFILEQREIVQPIIQRLSSQCAGLCQNLLVDGGEFGPGGEYPMNNVPPMGLDHLQKSP